MAGYNDLERERAIKCVLLDIQNSLRRKTQTKRYNGKPAQIQRLEALIEKDDLTIKSPGKGLHKPTAEQLRNILKDTFGGVKIFTSLDHLTSEERQKWLKKPKKGLQSPRAQNTQPPARPSRGTVKPVGTYAEDAFEGEDPILESTKPNTPQNVDSTARPAAKLFLKRSLNHVASASTSSKREQSVMIQESGVSSRAAEPLVPITTLSADTHTNVGSEPVQIEAKATRVVEQSPETSRTAEIEESSPLSPPHLDVMGASPSNAKRGASEALGEPDGLEANKRVKVAAQEDRLGNLDAAGNDYMKLVQHNLAPEDTAVSKQEIDIETTGQAEMLEAKSSDRVNEKAPAQQQLDMAPGDPGAESNSQSYPEHLRYAQNIGVQVELLVSRIRNAATTISEEIKASNTRARFLGTPGAELEGLYTRILTTDGGNWKEGAVPVLAAGSRIEHLLSACIGAALFDEVFTKPVPWQTPQDISHELRDAIPIADALLKWLRAGKRPRTSLMLQWLTPFRQDL